MENYHYLNQKTEIILNQDKLFLPLNKNFQYQNLFRGDSNINKQKGRIYNLNNKKEIHFTTRAKDNELAINGPKMLTMNFPPGFMLTDNNNSRKTASHEKNIYLQQNMANNMELNEIGSDNEKIFANTFKKGFQEYNDNNENMCGEKNPEKKNNIDFFGQKQKSISIKFNNNENINNLQKKNVFYTGSGSSLTGFNSTGNTGYIRSETELNSGRGATSSTEKEKEKNYEIYLNHIKTEGDFEQNKNYSNTGLNNYKSSSNSNIPFNIYINSHQNNKLNANFICNSNLESDINNNYSSNNSNNSKDKFSKNNSFGQKNMNSGSGSSSSNKLVFNPSSITNQRIMKKSSDSEIGLNHLYLGNKKYKELKKLNNHLSYSNINDNYNKNNNKYYYYNKSEKNTRLSPSQEKSANSQSRDKNHTKTQTDFEKKTRPNYYENLIYELENKYPTGSKFNINSAAEYNMNILEKFTTKKNINNLNIGIIYKINNDYKYFFNIPNGQIYILREYNINYEKEIFSLIKEWNKKYENDGIYLKIYENDQDSSIGQNIVIQYPAGGESLNDIINSVGFYDQNYLFDIVTKIYKTIIKIKEDKNNDNYINIPFCLCDIFINVNEHIKIIPPSIRKLLNSQNSYNKPCICKNNLSLLQQQFNINKDSISYFCLGFLIIQIITQNLIFEINSYKSILKKTKRHIDNNNYNNFISYKSINKNNIFIENKCCLAHLLLDSEKQLKGNEYLLFSHFLNLYPKSLLSFLHECTSFKNKKPSSSNEFLNLYDTNKNLNLSMKEILEITTLPKNEYINIDDFLNDFKKIYKDININPNDYFRKLNSNKTISVLSRSFDIDKEKFSNQIIKVIEENNNYINDYDEKNKFKEKNFFEDKKHLENISPIFIDYNKKKNNNVNSNIIFNNQNNIRKLHNYRSSGNYENE